MRRAAYDHALLWTGWGMKVFDDLENRKRQLRKKV